MNRPRRRRLLALIAAAWLQPATVLAQAGAGAERVLRQMQIHRVAQLGLEIWVENQPPWETELHGTGGQASFVAQSPASYHPPTVMSYSSWPKEKVVTELVATMAAVAIRRASQNYGLNAAESRAIVPQPASYGALQGFEASFVGRVGAVPMDVTIFVGQARGRFPVVLSVYTLQGKMALLREVLRRGWGQLAYLKA